MLVLHNIVTGIAVNSNKLSVGTRSDLALTSSIVICRYLYPNSKQLDPKVMPYYDRTTPTETVYLA